MQKNWYADITSFVPFFFTFRGQACNGICLFQKFLSFKSMWSPDSNLCWFDCSRPHSVLENVFWIIIKQLFWCHLGCWRNLVWNLVIACSFFSQIPFSKRLCLFLAMETDRFIIDRKENISGFEIALLEQDVCLKSFILKTYFSLSYN